MSNSNQEGAVRMRVSVCPIVPIVPIVVMMLVFGIVGFARAQNGGARDHYGTCSGTWDGAGTGGFELILEKGDGGALAGRVSVTGEPTYKATLKTVAIADEKLSATYDFPPDDSVEIVLAATFDGDKAKGTWSARGKNGGSEVAAGGWSCTRK
jgi:hypothetical protein